MKIKVSAGIIGAVLMLSASQSWAVTLKLSHNQDKSHPVHKAMEFFAKKSKEYSNGDITIRIYPNGTLGTQRETMELIRSGAIPLVKTNAAEMEAFKIPINYLACLICSAIVIIIIRSCRAISGEKSSTQRKAKVISG